ncbi:response regulator transcription factor [Bacillus sp. AK031]
MESNNGMLSLKRNTDFLRKNDINFFILDYAIHNKLSGEDNVLAWKAVKDTLPYNSFFLELGIQRAAVIYPTESASEAETLFKESIDSVLKEVQKPLSIAGKVYSDITEGLELQGIIYESAETAPVDDSELLVEDEQTEGGNDKKILRLSILDDDEVIRMFLGDQLDAVDWGEWEVDLEVYREGESFFNSGRLNDHGKHIIVLDGIMPRMDGMEVLSEIRKEYSENQVSIIMLTSRNRENDIVSAFEAGAFDYVTKPFKINELIARIKRVAKRMEDADA